jgi:pimeloyl-ACP methyl ester carboxylesterase
LTIEEKTVRANGLEFGYLEAGEGPAVLLLHGFPDNAWSWEHQLKALAEGGYRAIAPFMRGYAPTQVPSDAKHDFMTLGRDAVELASALSPDRACLAVGHDIGALQLQAAVAQSPQSFDRPVFVSVNHSATAGGVALVPRLAHRSFHLWLLAHPGLNEVVAAHEDMALIDYLWELWSPPGADYGEQLDRVKRTLSQEGALRSAVSVYPNFIPTESTGIPEEMLAPVDLPVMLMYGSDDVLPAALTEGEEQHHRGGFRREVIDGAVHWPHRENPAQVNSLLLEWFGAEDAPVPATGSAARAAS